MVKSKTQFLVGTSGWTYKGWGDKFYPKDLAQKYWFSYYSAQFNIVEINATYYRLFNEAIYTKWRQVAPKNFLYIIKVPGLITHRKKLLSCSKEIKKFCHLVSFLKNKLGLLLMQLPPSFPYDLVRLERALLQFDYRKKIVVEFRSQKWLTEDTRKLLKKLGCAFCISDSPGLKTPQWVTSRVAYVRLHGHTRWYDYDYSAKELKAIAKLVQALPKQGARKIFILFNNDVHAFAPKNAESFKRYLMGGHYD